MATRLDDISKEEEKRLANGLDAVKSIVNL